MSKYYIRKFEQNREIIRTNRVVVYFTESDKKFGSFFRNLYKDYKAYFYRYIYGPNDYMQLFNLAKNCMYQSINLIITIHIGKILILIKCKCD